jgi:hypothetical protein
MITLPMSLTSTRPDDIGDHRRKHGHESNN